MLILNSKIQYNDLYKALKIIINWTIQNKPSSFFYSDLQFSKECLSIHFQLPRRSGHSTMIKKLVKEDNFKDSIVIFRNSYQLNFFGRNKRFITVDNLNKTKGLNISSVIVDNASSFSNDQIESIYKNFSSYIENENFFFLFME